MSKDPSSLLNLLLECVKNLSRKSLEIVLVTHRQADPDGLCAAAGLSLILKDLFDANRIEVTILAPQGASVLGSHVCAKLGIDFVKELDRQAILRSDIIVALDVGEPALLEPYSESIFASRATKILIDHHTTFSKRSDSDWKGFETALNMNATSTCEIIVHSFPENLSGNNIALILLTGLLFDSQHLGIANAYTLEAALSLVRSGAEIEQAKLVLRSRPDRSETIARIKSAQRLQSTEIGKYFVLTTEVSSFQAAVARMLVEMGGDVGIAFGKSNGEARVSVRSTTRFFKESAVDLGILSNEIAKSKGMNGGGHPTAASISGKAEPAAVVGAYLDAFRRVLLGL